MNRSRAQSEPLPPEDKKPDLGGGYTVLTYLVAGVAVYGGLGWLLDWWLGTTYLLPVGIILGAGLGIVLVVRRYGQEASGSSNATEPKASSSKEEPPDSEER